MKMFDKKFKRLKLALMSIMLVISASTAHAVIDGVTGTVFNMTADYDRVSTGDGNSVYFWGFKMDDNALIYAQYPGPTLLVDQGATITINLTNTLPEPVSIVFPGQSGIIATGADGLLTKEAAAAVGGVNGTASYTFTVTNAGTFLYHSGTNMDKQVEMGLLGAIIVRPAVSGQAYGHVDSTFDQEYLYLMTEMDLDVHLAVEANPTAIVDFTAPKFEYWFLNGRTAVDTLFDAGAGWLPNQPYNSLPMMHPGERLLLRVISAGKDSHPLHPHGNNLDLIARDGRLLESVPGAGADLAYSDYNLNAAPGATYDFLFEWTGKKLGWDLYGTQAALAHTCVDAVDNRTGLAPGDGFHDVATDKNYWEYCADHGKALPTILPENQDVTIGGFYSGSAFLGDSGALPPGEGGLNPWDGYFFPWHSHHEKELTNFDIYPGGMLTFFSVVPWGFNF